MKLPTLYKLSSALKLQVWEIKVSTEPSTQHGVITTRWGQEDGLWQEGSDVIRSGKNVGKKNETTPFSQAVLEARARWKKQIERKGYVEDRAKALAGETDAEGGIAPMLAQPLEKTSHIEFPCDAQRKYNGVRLIAVIKDGKCTLWSRRRTPILGLPHIAAAYEGLFKYRKDTLIFDGEAYRHGWSLQQLSGYARVKEPKEGYEEIGHYVYDFPPDPSGTYRPTWATRSSDLCMTLPKNPVLHKVPSTRVYSMKEVEFLHDNWVAEGYEGVILRNNNALYEFGKRSYHLAKYKKFRDSEFPIIAVKDGRGKFEGKAVFTCRTPEGKEFDCCAPGTMEDRAEFMRRGSELVGKKLTVKFFEYSDEQVPIFPVGVAIRDYE